MKLTELLLSQRFAYINDNKDINALHDLIAKHMYISREESERLYKLDGDFVKKRVTISGEPTPIFDLFTCLNRLGVQYESITQTTLRIDLSVFINTVL